MCTSHFCVVCGHEVDFRAAARAEQADRSEQGKRRNALVCDSCASKSAKSSARNKGKQGAKTPVLDLEYRITMWGEYDLSFKAEFCKAGWLACDGCVKSKALRNMMWQRKLETLDRAIASGSFVPTREFSLSIIREGHVLEVKQVAYEGKADFLAYIRDLVEPYKAEAYLEAYGKTLGYKLREE